VSRPARRERLALATPPGWRGFLWRWYPAILAVVWIPIGTEVGGAVGHYASRLGHTVVPGIYPPWFALVWMRADVASDPMTTGAIDAVVLSFLACLLLLVTLVLLDFTSGRSFGIFNGPILILMLVSSIDMILEGIPPAYTWLGGGTSDGTYRGRRSPPARRET
jgi:hypothetical protein